MCLLFYRHLFQNYKGEPLPEDYWPSDDCWEDPFCNVAEDDQEQVGHRRKVKRKQVLP